MAGDSSSTSCDDSFRALPQAAPLFGTSRSAADRTHLAPLLAIVDGALVPSRDHTVAASSKNYQYSTNTQVGIDANSRLVVAIGRCPAASNDPQAFTASGGDQACRGAPTITDGRYQGTACSSRTRPDAPQPSRGSTTWPSTDISHPIQDNLYSRRTMPGRFLHHSPRRGPSLSYLQVRMQCQSSALERQAVQRRAGQPLAQPRPAGFGHGRRHCGCVRDRQTARG